MLPTFNGAMVITVEIFLTFMGGKIHTVTFNGRYKYSFELICLFTFALKSSGAHILGSVKLPAKLKSRSSIKSLSEELFLISVSSLLSLTCVFSLLSLSFSLVVSRYG